MQIDHSFVIDAVDKVNLAEELEENELNEIGDYLVQMIDSDQESRQEWLDQTEEWMKLATQVMEEKTFPWPGAANVKYPLLTTAALQFHARAYPALVSNEPVTGRVVGSDPDGSRRAAANRIGKHMSYQVLQEIPNWEEDMDRMLMVLPLTGLVFKKTYYSVFRESPVSELVLARDLIINYNAKDFESAPRKTHVQWFHPNEIVEYQLDGMFLDVDLGQAPSKVHNESKDKTQQMNPSSIIDEDEPHEFYECHTWWDLDDDGYKEPYIITVHRDRRKVVRIAPRFDDDSFVTNDDGDIIQIVPREHFTRFAFIPDPNSNIYGLGFGHLLGPTNQAANTLINQLLDSGTLSNMQSGFLAKSIRISGGSKRFRPGEWKTVATTGEDLAKGVYPLPVREPSTVLFQLLGTLLESGQQLSSTTNLMVGESPGQNQPATTSMAVLEQGMKVFTGIYKRIHRALSREYGKIYRINTQIPSELVFYNLVGGQNEKVYAQDYRLGKISVIPSSDPENVTNTQKMMKAEALWPMVQMGTVNPQEATRRMLEAQGHEDPDRLMKLPEPQPDPEIVLERAKFEHERRVDWARFEAETLRAQAAALKDEAEAMAKIADASSTEGQMGLDRYQAEITAMKTREDMLNQRLKALTDLASTQQKAQGTQQSQMTPGQRPQPAQAQTEPAANIQGTPGGEAAEAYANEVSTTPEGA